RDFHVTGVQTCALPISTRATPKRGAGSSPATPRPPSPEGGASAGSQKPGSGRPRSPAGGVEPFLKEQEARGGHGCRAPGGGERRPGGGGRVVPGHRRQVDQAVDGRIEEVDARNGRELVPAAGQVRLGAVEEAQSELARAASRTPRVDSGRKKKTVKPVALRLPRGQPPVLLQRRRQVDGLAGAEQGRHGFRQLPQGARGRDQLLAAGKIGRAHV